MEANELRIGNLVFDERDEIVRIESIFSTYMVNFKTISNENLSTRFPTKHIRGIGITEELLFKLGFEYSHRLGSRNFYNIGIFYIEICAVGCAVYYTKKGELICFVKFLNQLQNLYFAIVGAELKYKED